MEQCSNQIYDSQSTPIPCEKESNIHEHYIDEEKIRRFEHLLIEDEKCRTTRKKYVRDVRELLAYTGENGLITKEIMIGYKQHLVEKYSIATVNGMLASINSFLKKMNWYDCIVKSLKVQREAFRSQERELTREEYYRLLETARSRGNKRLYLLMGTICSTGIRVSELPFITVEALCTRRARVSLKGKTRTVILSQVLCRELKQYVKEKNIRTGSIFITRNGQPLNRSNIFKEMKSLCEDADVDRKKYFPIISVISLPAPITRRKKISLIWQICWATLT